MINRLVKLSFHAEDAGKFTSYSGRFPERSGIPAVCLHFELWKIYEKKGVFHVFSMGFGSSGPLPVFSPFQVRLGAC